MKILNKKYQAGCLISLLTIPALTNLAVAKNAPPPQVQEVQAFGQGFNAELIAVAKDVKIQLNAADVGALIVVTAQDKDEKPLMVKVKIKENVAIHRVQARGFLGGLFARSHQEINKNQIDQAVLPIDVGDSVLANDLIAKTQRLMQQKRYADAIVVFQEIIEKYWGKTVAVETGRYMDVRRFVEKQILNDEKLLLAYRMRYGGEAKRAYLKIAELEDKQLVNGYEDLIKRYRLTDAGLQASLDLSALYLTRGHADWAQYILKIASDHYALTKHQTRYIYLKALTLLYLNKNDEALTRKLKVLAPEQWASYQKIKKSIIRPTRSDEKTALGKEPLYGNISQSHRR